MGSKANILDLGDLSANGAGASVSIEGKQLAGGTFFAFGTFVATVALEVTPDGTNWIAAPDTGGTAISVTAPAAVAIGCGGVAVRANVSGYSSGTVKVRVLPR